MPKTLYEEALADAKKLKEVAENNAKKAVEEAVLPKIRDLIERQLFEDLEEVDSEDNPVKDDVLLDLVGGVSDSASTAASISPPDEEGKVTLDLDNLQNSERAEESEDHQVSEDENSELELSVESLQNMFSSEVDSLSKMDESLSKIEENVNMFLSASKLIRESKEFNVKIEELIEQIKDTYQYVQERLSGALEKSLIENKLEGYFKQMNGLKETTMKNVKNLMNEGDLTIKLTGVPEDLDVDDLGIDLITGEDESEETEAEAEVELPSDDSTESSDADADDLDLDMESDQDDNDMEEADMSKLDDDDVVEISESMLRDEIARMRSRRLQKESSMPVDDFGGGSDEGDPWLDGDVTTAEDDQGPELHGEGLEAVLVSLRNENKLQREAYARYSSFLAEAKKGKKGAKEMAKKEAYKVKRSKKKVSELKNKLGVLLQNEGVVNRQPVVVAEGNDKVESLRAKLNEQNLFNAKLLATNKLLQNESLSTRQKGSAIERLDEAKTVREVKLVYESIVKALSNRRSLAEGTSNVLGSSSRATRPGSTLNESVSTESDRWARLAGIKK